MECRGVTKITENSCRIKKVELVQYANLYPNKILAYSTLILCPVCSSNTMLCNILLANECIFFVISVHWSLKIPQSIWNSFEATKLEPLYYAQGVNLHQNKTVETYSKLHART